MRCLQLANFKNEEEQANDHDHADAFLKNGPGGISDFAKMPPLPIDGPCGPSKLRWSNFSAASAGEASMFVLHGANAITENNSIFVVSFTLSNYYNTDTTTYSCPASSQ